MPVNPWDAPKSIEEFNPIINPYAGFDLIPGQLVPEVPKLSEVPGAAWRDGATGNLAGILLESDIPVNTDKKYNVYNDIPDRHLNESGLKYYVNSMSQQETERITMQIDREERDNAIREQYPIANFAASIFADPLSMALPVGKTGTTLKAGYEAALAAGLKGAKISAPGFAKQVAKGAATAGLTTLGASAATESLIQQTHITKTVADSFYDMGASAFIGTGLGALGSLGVGAASIMGVRNAKSQAVNTAAGIPDVLTIMPKSKMKPGTEIRPNGPMGPEWPIGPFGPIRPFNPQGPNGPIRPIPEADIKAEARPIGQEAGTVGAKGRQLTAEELALQRMVPEQVINVTPITRAVMESNNRVAGVPEWIQHATKFSVANQLQISPFATGPYVNRLLYSNPLASIANVDNNIASPRALDDRIFGRQQALWSPAKVKINQIFMEQQGIKPGALEGARSRLANAMSDGKSLNRDQFSLSVFEVLNTNVRSNHESVNKVAEILRNEVMLPMKKELVGLKLLHPKFLSSEYDAYFHRMWMRGAVGKNPNEFEQLLFKFFQESRDFYRNNKTTIDELKRSPESTKAEIDLVRNRKDLSIAEKNALIVKLTNRMMDEYSELYEFIPAEYMPADGHIPSIKDDSELAISANQTLMRILGTDIDSTMSIFGAGGGGADPLEARALGMPNDYSADIVDSDGIMRTVSTSDFIEKDFDRVFSKVVRQLTPLIESTKLANELGFEKPSDLERFLLESLEEDYNFSKKGLQGKEATKLTNQYKADQKRISYSFETLNNVTGQDFNAYGPAYAKFMRHISDYNRVRMLGSAALSSIPDLMVGPFRQGFASLVSDWIVPLGQRMVTFQKNKAVAINQQDAKNLGFGLSVEMGKIAKALQNEDELLIKKAWWGNIAEPIVNMQGNISGVNFIQDLVQNANFSSSVSRTMRTIDRQVKDKKISERNRIRLRSIGIPDEDVKIIHKMWKEAIGNSSGKEAGVYYSDMGNWRIDTPERIRAYQNFRDATVRDVRQSQTVATAGDKWRKHQDTTVRSMLQFKDFLFAANNKILLSGIQKLGLKEYDVILTTMLMLGLGAMTYILTSLAKDPTGEKLDLSADKLFHEALDRSALLGLWGEFKNVGTKAGVLPEWMGAEVSRFHSRGIFGAALGPSIGSIEDMVKFTANVKQHMTGDKDFTVKDMEQFRRFLPYQNLFYLRYIFEQVTESLGTSLGAQEK